MCERVKVFRGLERSTALPILAVAAHRGGWEKEFVRDCSVYDHSFSLFADMIRYSSNASTLPGFCVDIAKFGPV